MRLLWLSHVLPHPPKGGVLQRSYHLLRAAAEENDVDLLTFRQRAFHPDIESLNASVEALSEFVDVKGVHDLKVDRRLAGKLSTLVSSVFTRDPYTIRWNASQEMEHAVRELAATESYDAVHFDTVGMFQYRSHFPSSAWALNYHNIESQMILQRAGHAALPLRAYLTWEGVRLRDWERRQGVEADVHLVVSPLDGDRLREHVNGAPVAVVENAVDTEDFRPLGTPKREGHLVFIGRIDGYANLSAVRWLRDEIWPMLLRGDRARTLGIVGRNPPPDVVAWGASDPTVEVTGFVDDVRGSFDEATVFVCPIYEGGGTRLKLLDAMSMGLPIVSHSMAIEGLDVVAGEHLFVADDAAGIARAVEHLLGDETLRENLGRAARERVIALYSTHAVKKHLLEAYDLAVDHSHARIR